MIQLTILSGRKAGTQALGPRFPLAIGRSPQCAIVLDDDGIWDRHAEITVRETTVSLTAGPDAAVTLNGERVRQSALRNGDLIELASVKIRFGLSPTRQRNLWLRESVTWIALAAVSLAQVALIYLLAAE